MFNSRNPVAWGGHRGKPSLHSVTCQLEPNSSQSEGKLTEDGKITNRKRGGGQALQSRLTLPCITFWESWLKLIVSVSGWTLLVCDVLCLSSCWHTTHNKSKTVTSVTCVWSLTLLNRSKGFEKSFSVCQVSAVHVNKLTVTFLVSATNCQFAFCCVGVALF